MKNTAEKQMELTLGGFRVFFTRVTEWEEDKDYGADADGRGGVSMAVILSDEAVDIQVFHGNEWKPLLEVDDKTRLQLEDDVEKWIEEYDPELE